MTVRLPIPDPPHQGGCLCGQVRYRLDARPLAMNACHCNDCKKLSGATNLLMLIVLRADFHLLGGELHRYRKLADSGRQVDIVRCAICGTRLWHEPLSLPQQMFLAAGTLDDSSWVVPTSHIWIEKAAPHMEFHKDTAQIQGQPAERQTLLDAFKRLYP